MYEYCLGINPCLEGAGFKKVLFAPCFDFSEKITHADGFYDTDFGRISVSWEKESNGVKYTVAVPDAVTCEFKFEKLTVLNKSFKNGIYEFHLQK